MGFEGEDCGAGRSGRVVRLVLVPPSPPPSPSPAPLPAGDGGASTAWCGDGASLQEAILAGKLLMVAPSRNEGAAALDWAAAKLSGKRVAFVRIGNTLASPLTVGRIVFQVAGGNTYGEEGDDEARRVLQALAERGRGSRHLVLAVDGAHNLAPPALAFLKLLAGVQAGVGPAVQVVLAGGSRSYVLLAEERFRAIREVVRARLDVEAAAAARGAVPRPVRVGVGIVVLAMLGLAFGAAVPKGLAPLFGSGTSVALPAPPAPPVVVADMLPLAPVRPEDAAMERGRLRRAFDATLVSQGPAARRLPAVERERMFRDYLARHGGAESGTESGAKPGAKSEAKSGTKSEAKSEAKSGARSEAKSGADAQVVAVPGR